MAPGGASNYLPDKSVLRASYARTPSAGRYMRCKLACQLLGTASYISFYRLSGKKYKFHPK